MEASKKFGEIIKSIREKKLNFTQKEFGDKLGITTVYVSYLEKGKRPPSKSLIEAIYSLIGERVPPEVEEMLGEIKKVIKNKSKDSPPIDIIYELQERNIYKYPLLKKALRSNPKDITIMYGLMRILIEEGKATDAKRYLLKYLMKVDKPEDKKWLEASYYELEGNYPIAITFLEEAISEFNKNNPSPDEREIKIKARFIFQLASMLFKMGQKLYKEEKHKQAAEYFQKALKWHNEIRKIYNDPFYQMDYAGIFLWLALIGIDSEKNWQNYIKHAKEALYLNHYKGIDNFSFTEWKGLYSKPYVISTMSYLARAYAQLSVLEKDKKKKLKLLSEGEFILVQHTPADLSSKYEEYYRFYFNQACFYSLKSEVMEGLEEDFEDDLNRCYVNLQEAKFADENNRFNLFTRELQSSLGLKFYREKRNKQLVEFL